MSSEWSDFVKKNIFTVYLCLKTNKKVQKLLILNADSGLIDCILEICVNAPALAYPEEKKLLKIVQKIQPLSLAERRPLLYKHWSLIYKKICVVLDDAETQIGSKSDEKSGEDHSR